MLRRNLIAVAWTMSWMTAAANAQAVATWGSETTLLNGSVAQATITDSQDDGLVDIVVTARRSAQNLQAVPIAIAAVSADQFAGEWRLGRHEPETRHSRHRGPKQQWLCLPGHPRGWIEGTNRAIVALDSISQLGSFGANRVNYAPPRTYGVTAGVKF